MSIKFGGLLLVFFAIILSLGCAKSTSSLPQKVAVDSLLPLGIDSSLYSVTTNDTCPKGEILLSFDTPTGGTLTVLNQDGQVLIEKQIGANIQNFQKWDIEGKTMYTYFYTTSTGSDFLDGMVTTNIGYEAICDSDLNVLNTVKLMSYGNVNVGVQDKIDQHEFILLGTNHYICDTYYLETPTNIPSSLNPLPGVQVAACIIQEVNNGQVVFQWDGTNYPELYLSSVENNNFSGTTAPLDYMHLNSICVDSSDNNLIVSFRNLDEIVKLNRQTGAIMWRLGGANSDFSQTANEQFLRQHYARFTDNGKTLIFIDNGDATLRSYSRILEFQLDEANKTITSFKAFNVPDSFIQYAGSVKKEGDDYFIAAGSSPYCLEVNYNTNAVLMRINQFYTSYRGVKY